MNVKTIRMLSMAFVVTFIAVCIIIFPQDVLEASRKGVEMWSQSVLPALLPFFIIAELLIAFGVVSFIGVLLEPLMRPLFRVPGCGGFVWAMGFASGFPSGAKFTVRLREAGKLTREEAERLVSFTNSSSPLFIFGAISVGFFHDPTLGLLLAFAHYASNTTVGILMRFYKHSAPPSPPASASFSIGAALRALKREQENDKRPLGKKLGDALTTSIHTLLMVGGFIVLFSVLYRIMHVTGLIHFVALIPAYALHSLQFAQELAFPWVSGFFEITVGSKLTSDLEHTSLLEKAIVVSFILGFSGFSVQAQVASLLADSDLRFKPFFIARWLHGCLAALFTYLAWEPFYKKLLQEPTFNGNSLPTMTTWWDVVEKWLSTYGSFFTIAALLLYVYTIHRFTLSKRNET
ncbi:sporulation integral membrane protein YlbJ [Bacillus piscicola]|uniref:sporulation integral membrane protein YlbJ n=1 Tax=Bacillus piscicola TaxID=1632684 RepID=UPI001F08FFA6|nr:sporulation integral membrane protein YlbJ [Bacillus piscicola]